MSYKDPIVISDSEGNPLNEEGLNKEIYKKVESMYTETEHKAQLYAMIKSCYYNFDDLSRCRNGEFTIPIHRLFSFMSEAKMANLLDGDVAEFGVANGATTMFISLLCPEKTIYAFDTFEGFSPLGDDFFKTSDDNSWSDDTPHWRNWGSDFNWKRTIERLENIHNVVIKKGIFPDTTKGMEDKKFSLVHIDVDIYESTKVGLEYFWDRMVDGGMILIDDFDLNGKSFPQVYHAVKDFFREVEPKLSLNSIIAQITNMQGLIIKPFDDMHFIDNGKVAMKHGNLLYKRERLNEL